MTKPIVATLLLAASMSSFSVAAKADMMHHRMHERMMMRHHRMMMHHRMVMHHRHHVMMHEHMMHRGM